MNPVETAQDWFQQLAPRERIMVLVCGAFIVLALIWQLVINPLFVTTAELDKRVTEKTNQLALFQEQASQVWVGDATSGASGAAEGAGANQSIVVIIDRTTRSLQLAQYLKRNQPDGNTGVRLRFEGAPFDALITWIGELETKYGMVTVSANFDRTAAGRVNCSLVIARSGT